VPESLRRFDDGLLETVCLVLASCAARPKSSTLELLIIIVWSEQGTHY